MGISSIEAYSSFIAPPPKRFDNPVQFGALTVPPVQQVKTQKEQPQTPPPQQQLQGSAFAVHKFNLGCPRADFDTLDLLA